MVRYYKGVRVLITGETDRYKINVPDGVVAKAIDVDDNGNLIFKADVTDAQHNNIIALGNTEILSNNLITEVKNMFGSLYDDSEIIEWRDTA